MEHVSPAVVQVIRGHCVKKLAITAHLEMTAENIVKAVVTTTATIYMGRAYLGVSMVTKETCVKHIVKRLSLERIAHKNVISGV